MARGHMCSDPDRYSFLTSKQPRDPSFLGHNLGSQKFSDHRAVFIKRFVPPIRECLSPRSDLVMMSKGSDVKHLSAVIIMYIALGSAGCTARLVSQV